MRVLNNSSISLIFRFIICSAFLLALSLASSTMALAAAEEEETPLPTASLPENRLGSGFVPDDDEPVCPNEFGSGRAGRNVSDSPCLALDPRHVNGDGSLKTENFRNGSRTNSWKVYDKGANEWVDFWFENYIFTGEKHTGRKSRFYKLCGCYRDYRRSGCFSPETKITMADGTQKQVRDISAGEFVMNAVTGQPARITRIIEGPEQHPLVEISVGTKTLRVSKEHPMLVFGAGLDFQTISLENSSTPQGSLYRADQLLPGMVLKLEDGSFSPISSINRPEIEEGQFVVNFVLESDDNSDESHLLISEGVVSGDLILQRRLAKRQQRSAGSSAFVYPAQ